MRQTDRQTNRHSSETDRQTDRQTDTVVRQRDRQTDTVVRQTDRRTDTVVRQTDRQTDRRTDRVKSACPTHHSINWRASLLLGGVYEVFHVCEKQSIVVLRQFKGLNGQLVGLVTVVLTQEAEPQRDGA